MESVLHFLEGLSVNEMAMAYVCKQLFRFESLWYRDVLEKCYAKHQEYRCELTRKYFENIDCLNFANYEPF